jgi:hypothetical protein
LPSDFHDSHLIILLQDEAALRREFDELLKTITTPPKESGGPSKEEMKKLKDTVFGPMTYWVTETRPIQVGA